jgi:cell pole-organizing protein PopZ
MTAIPVSTTQDGGMLLSNGFIEYQDGTRRQATPQDVPQVLARFSDGSVLLENGQFINASDRIGRAYRGLGGLMDILFGKEQTVTQQYGNINPIEPTPGNVNLGTDIRTKDLPGNFYFTLPFEAEVIQITRDDGTRFGEQSGHKGYGNSVLLRLPNGSMIRMAHLSDMENFSVGNIVRAFDYIGTPGQTGNTYGEHLDLEYYNPDGQIADPESFLIDSMDYINTDEIMQSRVDSSNIKPEEKQWLEDQQRFIEKGVQANPMYPLGQPRPNFDQPQNMAQNIGQTVQNVGQNLQEAVQPMSPQRQALGQGIAQVGQAANLPGLGVSELVAGDRQAAGQEIAQTGQKYGLPELQASELISGQATPGEALSRNIEQANLTPGIDTGFSELLRGDVEGAKANFADTLARAKARIQRMPEEIGRTIVPEVSADNGEQERKETLGENLAGAGRSITQWAGGKLAQAGEGLDTLKDKVSNAFQKTPLMGLFQGQKQVGYETPGITMIETTGQRGGTPTPDAFFRYGGADQYGQYLIDNAEQARGGALSTSLFKPEFYQDPNRVANVFGETSQGAEATGKYKEYLGSQIKPGFNEPYRTEQKQEGDTLYEYKIPVQEYFQNQYYQNLLAETPETLKSGFSWDQFQMPTVSRSASEYKGEVPTKTGREPIFKSGAVDLFKRTGTKVGQLAGDIFKTPAPVYQPSQQSQKFEVPENLSRIFQSPAASFALPQVQKTAIALPQVQKTAISKPTLSDYLAKGKTAAQWYAETGQQSTLDAMNKAKAFTSPQSIANFNSQIISSVSPEQARRIGQSVVANRAQEKAQGGIKLPTGAIATVAPANQSNTSGASAQLSGSANNSKSVFSSAADWLKKLFKK